MKKTTAILFALLALIALPAAAEAPADPHPAEATAPAALCDAAPRAAELQPVAEATRLAQACEVPPPLQDRDCVCALIYDPVCGCNGETYSNACFARCEVLFWTPGECGSSS
ncbi:MAG TPA: Kazal-type serine protease inhibitor domain-containing protein [Thermoanaerobaculia bacterium]|nr:Kazal-type serine protease inhibitor domain-containing protein [Thermoanaerobaculia bacterium]